MANFQPSDFGNIGLSYANWQKMAGISDTQPFGAADEQPEQKPVQPLKIDAAMPPVDYSIKPAVPPTGGLGASSQSGVVLPKLPSLGAQTSTLSDAFKQYYDTED